MPMLVLCMEQQEQLHMQHAHANTNKSTILTNLETWYTSKMTAYTNKLADTIWCNDKSTVANSHYYYLDGTSNE
jgi:hypothetical protein